ncbi:MAG: cytochrome c3 family protein [Vicinamibacterales bacterium]
MTRLLALRGAGAALIAGALLLLPDTATAQTSRCADCHFANVGASGSQMSAFAERHLEEWDHSPHARNNVGCEKCHGGDATTFEAFRAHQGLLNSRNPASPINRANLPRTCGTCHTGPFVSFQKSKHYELLRGGNDDVPTCTTCHGEVGAHLLSPTALASRCSTCHGANGIAPNTDRPADARLLLTEVASVRGSLDEARGLIRRIRDAGRKAELEEEYRQAEVPLIEAVQAGHEFVYDNLRERLALAATRANALLERLANQPR